jgi:hypothetical protein
MESGSKKRDVAISNQKKNLSDDESREKAWNILSCNRKGGNDKGFSLDASRAVDAYQPRGNIILEQAGIALVMPVDQERESKNFLMNPLIILIYTQMKSVETPERK